MLLPGVSPSPRHFRHLSLWLRARYGDTALTSVAPSYLSAESQKGEVMQNSAALQVMDSFHLFSLSSWLTFLFSTFFCLQSCFSLLFLHVRDLVLPVLSPRPSLNTPLLYTFVDKLLPACANPFQTPSYPSCRKCQNSPEGP